MNNIGKNVDSMNFEELRSFVKVLANSVQELSDLYAKTKREYNDMLYNLSRDNLSIEYIAEQESMFEQTENGLKSVIAKNIASLRKLTDKEKENATPVNSFEEMTDKSLIYKMPLTDDPNKFTYFCYYAPLDMWVPINEVDQQKYSTIEQTAEKIATSVNSAMTSVDSKLTEYSTIEQTEEKIATSVRETKQYVDDMLGDVELDEYTTIEQTAKSISTLAARQVDIKKAEKVSGVTEMTDTKKVYKVCYTDDKGFPSEKYYYYSDIANKWIPFQAENLYTVFQQTAEGFLFKGNVIIDGDAVVTKNLKAQKIVSQDGNEIGMLTISYNNQGVNFPDLTYYGKINGSYRELFGIRYDGTGAASIRLKENEIGYVGSELGYFWPQGTWNFSSQRCDVIGLGVVPVFG
jgi:arsenate reductase-like glutaredoxin family protein